MVDVNRRFRRALIEQCGILGLRMVKLHVPVLRALFDLFTTIYEGLKDL